MSGWSQPTGWKSKQTILQFIQRYKALPALWQVKCRGNQLQRELAYLELARFCQKFTPMADKAFVSNKINNLRSNWQKEYKKVLKSKQSCEDGEGKVYKPRLWYYPYLSFIQSEDTTENETETESKSESLDGKHQVSSLAENTPLIDQQAPTSPEAPSEHSFDLDSIQIHKVGDDNDLIPLKLFSPNSPFAEKSEESSRCSSTPDPDLHSAAHSTQNISDSPATQHSQSHQGPSPSVFSMSPHATSNYPKLVQPVANRPRKRKHEVDNDPRSNFNTARRRSLASPVPPPPLHSQDENDLFGTTIALLLKNTSREQNIYARKLMFEVMANAELGNLSRASYFVAIPGPSRSSSSTNVSSAKTNG